MTAFSVRVYSPAQSRNPTHAVDRCPISVFRSPRQLRQSHVAQRPALAHARRHTNICPHNKWELHR